MKLHNFIFVFLIIFLAVGIKFQMKQITLDKIMAQKQRYHMILETAAEDAAAVLVEKDRGLRPIIYKEKAQSVLFQSLFNGFGILQDIPAQEELKEYIPLIMVTDVDGCYFWYRGELKENGTMLCDRWSEKIPYTYYDSQNEVAVNFTIEDIVCVTDLRTYSIKQMNYRDVYKERPDIEYFKTEESFEEVRRTAIINTITQNMTSYVNAFNKIARQYGITYEMSIPYNSDTDWTRSIDDVSIVAVFQGYPFGNTVTEVYNCMEIGGARVKKME